MRIFREQAGVISEGPAWVAIAGGYLYIADTPWNLVLVLIFEWKHDRHLVG